MCCVGVCLFVLILFVCVCVCFDCYYVDYIVCVGCMLIVLVDYK